MREIFAIVVPVSASANVSAEKAKQRNRDPSQNGQPVEFGRFLFVAG
ncbi:MAG TPA: hypothetical protein VMJ33_05865 [Gallionella sp.]|nr:hypothetical protein [Gallionella sp.]